MATPDQPPALDARTYTGLGGAAIGLTLWTLQTYVFKSHTVPPEVTSYVYIFVPAVAGYVASHLTRKHTLDPLRASITEAMRTGSVRLLDSPGTLSTPGTLDPAPTTQPHSASSPPSGTSQGGLSAGNTT